MRRHYTILCSSMLAVSIFVLVLISGQVMAQDLYGGAIGFARSEESSIYVDDPINTWVDRDADFLFNVQYLRPFSETVFIGGYAEYERLNFGGNADDGSRFGFGLTWVARTSAAGHEGDFFAEFGGFGGYAFASIPELDSQSGFDFGIFFGPVYQVSNNIQIALHLADMYGWYSGDNPEGIQNVQPRVRIQLYYFPNNN